MKFVQQGVSQGKRPEFVGGGLIRSLGRWAEVLALSGRGEKQAYDQRILGDGEFVKGVLSEMDEIGRENLRLASKTMSISLLGERICKVHNISTGELKSGSRRHEIVEARRILSWLAVKNLGNSGAEVARYLGVITSCKRGQSTRKKSSKKFIFF